MGMKIVGLQKLDYVSRSTQKQVKGISISVVYPKDNYEGNYAENFYIGSYQNCYSKAEALKLGDTIEISWSREGRNRIEDIRVAGK